MHISNIHKNIILVLLTIILLGVTIYPVPKTYSFSLRSIPPIPTFDKVRPTPPRRVTVTPTPTATPTITHIIIPTITPTPTNTPVPLPRSLKNFTVSGGSRPGPKFTRGYLNPYGPLAGDNQKISVTLYFDTAITSLNATVTTDNNSVTVPLALTIGSDTFGTWEGSYPVTDTNNNKYKIIFDAAAGAQTSQLEINLR